MYGRKGNFFKLLVLHFTFFVSAIGTNSVHAQSNLAYELIMKSLNSLTDHDTYAIHFEALAQNLEDPKQIFKLPTNELFLGGYIYADKGRFELKMGSTKGLSDGKQIVYFDEAEKIMWVDSVRAQLSIPGLTQKQIQLEEQKAMNDIFGADSVGPNNCTYSGKETLRGRICHKVRADFKGAMEGHFIYWIDAQTNQMLLMGEWTGDAYNAYWVKKIQDIAPKGHDYSIHLPNTKMVEFYGFEVIDNRFIKVETEQAFKSK